MGKCGWTSTNKAEDKATLKVEIAALRGISFSQGPQGAERTGYIHRSKSVLLGTKCQRFVSHVFDTASNGSVNWPWSFTTRERAGSTTGKGRHGARVPDGGRAPCRPRREERGEDLEDYHLGSLRWRGSSHEGSSVYSGMENYHTVAEQECGMRKDPANVTSQNGRGRYGTTPASQGICDSQPREKMRQPTEEKAERRWCPPEKPRDLSPLVLGTPADDRRTVLEMRRWLTGSMVLPT